MHKSIIGILLGLVVGGGIYGLYINYGTKGLLTQIDAKELMDRCMILESNPNSDPKQIDSWLNDAKRLSPDIFPINAVTGAILDPNSKNNLAVTFNNQLIECEKHLKKRLYKYQ